MGNDSNTKEFEAATTPAFSMFDRVHKTAKSLDGKTNRSSRENVFMNFLRHPVAATNLAKLAASPTPDDQEKLAYFLTTPGILQEMLNKGFEPSTVRSLIDELDQEKRQAVVKANWSNDSLKTLGINNVDAWINATPSEEHQNPAPAV